jgi:hypothetical protein
VQATAITAANRGEGIVNVKISVVELSPLAPHFADDVGENDRRKQGKTGKRHLCWLPGTSVQKIGPLCRKKEAFLPTYISCAYNQHSPLCICALTLRPFSQRRGSIDAVSVFFDETMRLILLPWRLSRNMLYVDGESKLANIS